MSQGESLKNIIVSYHFVLSKNGLSEQKNSASYAVFSGWSGFRFRCFVVRTLLETFWLSLVMPRTSRSTNNSLSAGLPTKDFLPSTATSESPVTSTASSSWWSQLADSLTEAVARAIRNSISAIISSIQSNASSHVASSVRLRAFLLAGLHVCSYVYASVGHYRLDVGPPRGSYSLHFRIARRY